MTDPQTYTLDVPGATLRYDVRGELDGSQPVLFLVGCPMDASGFATLASLFADRTVVTYDPRGIGRSDRPDRTTETNPTEHVDDLHRVITELNVGPVDVFGSSGGAINGLALVEKHGDQVRTLVAHEPPASQVLPDRDQALAVIEDMYATYQASGIGPGMAKFIALTSYQGELPSNYLERPAPNPADFGMPTDDDGTRDDPLIAQTLRGTASYRPDFDALRATPTRIVLAAGVESQGILAYRGAQAVAENLGIDLTSFPSHHAGFVGDEYGPEMSGDPEPFAATLRKVLNQTDQLN